MSVRKHVGLLIAVFLVLQGIAFQAEASPIIFGVVAPNDGQVLQFDPSNLTLSSLPGANVLYAQLVPSFGPVVTPFAMTPLTSPTINPTSYVYGAGSFSLGIIEATFTNLTLDFSGSDLLATGQAIFSGVAFDGAALNGLGNPGYFGFNLTNFQSVLDSAGKPVASYQISGALAAEPVPEPSPLGLLGGGLLLLFAAPFFGRRLGWRAGL